MGTVASFITGGAEAAPRRFGGGSYSADAPRRDLWLRRFRVARVRVVLRARRHHERESRPGRLSHGIPGSRGLSESVPGSKRPVVRTVRLHLRLFVLARPRRKSDSQHRHGRELRPDLSKLDLHDPSRCEVVRRDGSYRGGRQLHHQLQHPILLPSLGVRAVRESDRRMHAPTAHGLRRGQPPQRPLAGYRVFRSTVRSRQNHVHPHYPEGAVARDLGSGGPRELLELEPDRHGSVLRRRDHRDPVAKLAAAVAPQERELPPRVAEYRQSVHGAVLGRSHARRGPQGGRDRPREAHAKWISRPREHAKHRTPNLLAEHAVLERNRIHAAELEQREQEAEPGPLGSERAAGPCDGDEQGLHRLEQIPRIRDPWRHVGLPDHAILVVRSHLRIGRELDLQFDQGEPAPGFGGLLELDGRHSRERHPDGGSRHHLHEHEWAARHGARGHAARLHDGGPPRIPAGTGHGRVPPTGVVECRGATQHQSRARIRAVQ